MRSSFYQGHFCLAPSRAGFQTNIGKTSDSNAATSRAEDATASAQLISSRRRLTRASGSPEPAPPHSSYLGSTFALRRRCSSCGLRPRESDGVDAREARAGDGGKDRPGHRVAVVGRLPSFLPTNQLTPIQRTHLGRKTSGCVRCVGVSATLYELLPA